MAGLPIACPQCRSSCKQRNNSLARDDPTETFAAFLDTTSVEPEMLWFQPGGQQQSQH